MNKLEESYIQDEYNTEKDTFEEDNIEQDTSKNDKPARQDLIKKIIKEVVLYAVIVFLFAFIVPNYVVQLTKVDGHSMTNTLKNHDQLLVNKFIYNFKEPERFDIVVFYPKGKDVPEEYFVKRIIGLPGETVQIKDSVIYIDGKALDENYGKQKYISDYGIAREPVKLSEDEYFVMGDNRNGSTDSRDPEVGPVKKENIDGQVFIRVYPFNTIDILT